jgi:hypothetical protein
MDNLIFEQVARHSDDLSGTTRDAYQIFILDEHEDYNYTESAGTKMGKR